MRIFAIVIAVTGVAATEAQAQKAPSDDWRGFYAGSHLGQAWGKAGWSSYDAGSSSPVASGQFGIFQPFDVFFESGSFNLGVQAGYNFALSRNVVAGIEADITFPAWPSVAGITTGGASAFTSPVNGSQTFS